MAAHSHPRIPERHDQQPASNLGCALALTGTFRQLVVVASGSILLVYLGVSLAVIQLRRKQGMPTAGQFCIPGGPLVPIPSSLFVIWLLAQMTASEALGLGGMLVFALGLYFARYVYQRRGSKRASEAN